MKASSSNGAMSARLTIVDEHVSRKTSITLMALWGHLENQHVTTTSHGTPITWAAKRFADLRAVAARDARLAYRYPAAACERRCHRPRGDYSRVALGECGADFPPRVAKSSSRCAAFTH